jgi:hypothetical protein
LRSAAPRKKIPLATTTAAAASPTLSFPAGISRIIVRGFLASMARSTILLNPIAANRAEVNAVRIRNTSATRTECS